MGHLAEADRDVRVARRTEPVDREAAKGGHAFRSVASTDFRGVLGRGGVTDEVEPVLDGLLRAHDLCETLRGCLAAGEVGQHENHLAGGSAGLL